MRPTAEERAVELMRVVVDSPPSAKALPFLIAALEQAYRDGVRDAAEVVRVRWHSPETEAQDNLVSAIRALAEEGT